MLQQVFVIIFVQHTATLSVSFSHEQKIGPYGPELIWYSIS